VSFRQAGVKSGGQRRCDNPVSNWLRYVYAAFKVCRRAGYPHLGVPRGGESDSRSRSKEYTQRTIAAIRSEEEKESYDIYSTLLQIKDPKVAGWKIIQETRAFELCLKPAPDQDAIYRPIIDDYVLKNRKTLVLERKFKLPQYTLAAPEEWTRSINPRISVFSAVGFNPDRTHAAVCFWAHNGGTCSILIKAKGTWQIDRDWRGGRCGWAA
jgi:hypothetical protein